MIFAPLLAIPTVIVAGAAAEVAPPSLEKMDTLAARLAGVEAVDRLAAAKEIAALPPSGVELYAKRLLRERTLPPSAYRAVVLEIWAQVPNPEYPQKGEPWMRKPEPAWKPQRPEKGKPRPKRPPPHDPDAVDWMTALAQLDLEAIPELAAMPERGQARAEALEAVALLKALGASKRFDAAEPIFEFSFRLEGVFRDECGRAVRSLESYAVPTLIRRMHYRGKGALLKHRRWAIGQLDRMDRARPQKAIQTAPDDAVRAAIVHAYGEVKAVDAVDALLGQIDSASRRVRREARQAWLGYVTGPPPPPAPMRKRKLPGGKEESEAKEDYLNYREMAELAIKKAVEDIRQASGDTREAKGSAAELTKELFAFYDKRRDAEWETQYKAAVGKRDAGDVSGAMQGFAAILADDPFHARRGEMAETFLAVGEQRFAAGDLDGAAGALRQGVALAAGTQRARLGEAKLQYIEGEQARRAGREDPAAFRRALLLDPQLEPARRVLGEFEAVRAQRRLSHWITVGAVAGGVGVGIALALLVLMRVLRRRVAVA